MVVVLLIEVFFSPKTNNNNNQRTYTYILWIDGMIQTVVNKIETTGARKGAGERESDMVREWEISLSIAQMWYFEQLILTDVKMNASSSSSSSFSFGCVCTVGFSINAIYSVSLLHCIVVDSVGHVRRPSCHRNSWDIRKRKIPWNKFFADFSVIFYCTCVRICFVFFAVSYNCN